jgi:hypothetical protein
MRRMYSDGMDIWMNGLDVYMHSMAFDGLLGYMVMEDLNK